MDAATAPMAFFAPRRERRRAYCAGRYPFLVRVADQAHWIRVLFSQGAPFFICVERLLPALSSFLGQSPGPADQLAIRCEAIHVETDLGDNDLGGEATDTRDGDQQLDGFSKGFQVTLDLRIDAGDSRIQDIEMIQMQL